MSKKIFKAIWVEAPLHEKIKKLAEEDDRSMNSYLRVIFKEARPKQDD